MENKKRFFEDLSELIACKSVLGTPQPNMPFGAETKRALDMFLNLAENFGFKTVNYDNYMGEAYIGNGEEIGIIGHLDVVPAGTGWVSDPFTLTERDGRLYGRGVLDDKAPTLLCLYALKALADDGVKFNKKVRLIVGCNEEAGWKDVEYFLEHGGTFPEWGFSPDGDFPVVYAEKGPNAVEFEFDYSGAFSNFCGGTVVNAVCADASVIGPIDDALIKKFNLQTENGVIKSKGKAAHGSIPELGKNAILPILQYMSALGEPVDGIIELLFNDRLGLTKLGNETGYATMSPDLIRQQNGKLIITADFRVPARMSADEFISILDAAGIKFTWKKNRDPLYVPKDSPFVTTLMNAYNAVMGTSLQPISQRGATFASVFKYGTAFGPEFPNKPGSIHEANENAEISDLEIMYEIYKKAIAELVR